MIPGASVTLSVRSGLVRFVSEFVTFDTVWRCRERNDQTLQASSHVVMVYDVYGAGSLQLEALPLSQLKDPVPAGQW